VHSTCACKGISIFHLQTNYPDFNTGWFRLEYPKNHDKTNNPQPHPATGEYYSPPLGGDEQRESGEEFMS
jgi:hypothetical protein